MALTAEEFEGQTVKSLKTLVAKQIGISRFRQRWLGEDHTELKDDALVSASDVQLVVLDFVKPQDWQIKKLFHACLRNQVDQLEELLRKPLDPDVMDDIHSQTAYIFGTETIQSSDLKGKTALHFAALNGHKECVALLLEAGANKDAVASAVYARSETPLHCASLKGHQEVVRLLLEAGANKEALDNDLSTPHRLADLWGHRQVVELLNAKVESG